MRRRSGHRALPPRRALAYLLAAALGGCGWGYARQLETPEEEEAAPRPSPRARVASTAEPPPAVAPSLLPAEEPGVELLRNARDLPSLDRNHRVSRRAASPDAMAAHAFQVRLVDALNDATQLIHCTTGKVVRFEKRPPAPGLLEARTAAGIPPGVWVFDVDPSGRDPDLPNNDWYRHVSKFHELEFIDRNRISGTVIYRYVRPRPTLSGEPGS